MDSLLSWINNNDWIIHVFGIVLVTVLTNFILRRVLNRLQQKSNKTTNLWDDAVIEAGRRPILLFVWVVGISLAAEIIELSTDTPNDIFGYTGLARQIAIIVLLMMFLVKLISKVERNIIKNKTLKDVNADEVTVRVVGRLLRISVLITGTLVVLQTLGISISGVLAFGGIGGVAVGFAAKDLLPTRAVFLELLIFFQLSQPMSVFFYQAVMSYL